MPFNKSKKTAIKPTFKMSLPGLGGTIPTSSIPSASGIPNVVKGKKKVGFQNYGKK